MRNIKDYGAVGDGKVLDTEAIQKAIDAGGMVYVPEGIYKIGTLYLKSNGGLHLAPGAILRGSHNREDYKEDNFCPQNRVFASELVTGAHLITAVEQDNVIIEGHGTIDGQGDFWMNESNVQKGWPDAEKRDYAANPERPAQMIFFCECKNVRVTDVNIINGPYWHLFFHGCEDVFARGLNIKGDRPRWTNDGIDVDCCSRVTISDCIIDVGDDGLTLRGYDEPLLYNSGRCEKVTVSNCVIRSARDYGVRIGVGDGLICNCCLSNLDIEAPNVGGIGIMGRWSPTTKTSSSVENILFSNCNVRSRKAIDIYTAAGEDELANECYIKNIRFDNMIIETDEQCSIQGAKDGKVENIIFSNIYVNCIENQTEPICVKEAEGVEYYNLKTNQN